MNESTKHAARITRALGTCMASYGSDFLMFDEYDAIFSDEEKDLVVNVSILSLFC